MNKTLTGGIAAIALATAGMGAVLGIAPPRVVEVPGPIQYVDREVKVRVEVPVVPEVCIAYIGTLETLYDLTSDAFNLWFVDGATPAVVAPLLPGINRLVAQSDTEAVECVEAIEQAGTAL